MFVLLYCDDLAPIDEDESNDRLRSYEYLPVRDGETRKRRWELWGCRGDVTRGFELDVNEIVPTKPKPPSTCCKRLRLGRHTYLPNVGSVMKLKVGTKSYYVPSHTVGTVHSPVPVHRRPTLRGLIHRRRQCAQATHPKRAVRRRSRSRSRSRCVPEHLGAFRNGSVCRDLPDPGIYVTDSRNR